MNYKTYCDLSKDIRKSSHKLKGGWDLVVGIPRSGMIPAYMIAQLLNLDCTDISSWVQNIPLARGNTRDSKKRLSMPREAEKVLLVDDSILTGKSIKKELQRLPEDLRRRATTLAVYSSGVKSKEMDIVLCHLPYPRVFEWNIYHHRVIERSCMSMEGVIATCDKNEVMFPNVRPSEAILQIVSSQPESSREFVESWLLKNEIKYKNLVLVGQESNLLEGENQSREPRFMEKTNDSEKWIAHQKARVYTGSSAKLYFEESKEQAGIIVKLTRKPVFCLATNEMLVPDFYYDPTSIRFVRRVINGWRKLRQQSA